MLKSIEMIMLNVMFGLSCGCLWILWEMSDKSWKWCFDKLDYIMVLVKFFLWWNGYEILLWLWTFGCEIELEENGFLSFKSI